MYRPTQYAGFLGKAVASGGKLLRGTGEAARGQPGQCAGSRARPRDAPDNQRPGHHGHHEPGTWASGRRQRLR